MGDLKLYCTKKYNLDIDFHILSKEKFLNTSKRGPKYCDVDNAKKIEISGAFPYFWFTWQSKGCCSALKETILHRSMVQHGMHAPGNRRRLCPCCPPECRPHNPKFDSKDENTTLKIKLLDFLEPQQDYKVSREKSIRGAIWCSSRMFHPCRPPPRADTLCAMCVFRSL